MKNTHIPTIRDVARAAGVSTTTVSRILNGISGFPQETVNLVKQVAADLQYTPHTAARGLVTRKTYTIGLVVNEISTPFLPPFLSSLEKVVREAGYRFLIYCSQWSETSGPDIFHPIGAHNTDGLIIFSGSLAQSQISRLYELNFPMVFIHHHPQANMNIPHLVFDNLSGARSAVDHLIEVHGYQRIAYLRGPENEEDSTWRELGYRQSLEAHGISVDERLIGMGAFDELVACQTVQHWLDEGLPFDAIFSGDDEAASGVVLCLRRAGVKVGIEVGVVGFDDIDLARHISPALTTVRSPIHESGKIVGEMLLQLINTGKTSAEIVLPVKLIIRQSCGCKEDANSGS